MRFDLKGAMGMRVTRREFLVGSTAALVPSLSFAAGGSLSMAEIDGVPIGRGGPPIYFVHRNAVIHGSCPAHVPFVQYVHRRAGALWSVPQGSACVRGGGPFALPYVHDGRDGVESVMCVGVTEPLPAGLVVDGPRWKAVQIQSLPIEVSAHS